MVFPETSIILGYCSSCQYSNGGQVQKGSFPQIFAIQFFAQTIHAFSFGLFHLIAMRIIFQNFSLGQQGRGQALYSTMWGLGVASGSCLLYTSPSPRDLSTSRMPSSA